MGTYHRSPPTIGSVGRGWGIVLSVLNMHQMNAIFIELLYLAVHVLVSVQYQGCIYILFQKICNRMLNFCNLHVHVLQYFIHNEL